MISDESKHEKDSAGDNDIQQDAREILSSFHKNFLGIVKDDVDAAPLLEHRQSYRES